MHPVNTLIREWAKARRGNAATLARELTVTPQTVSKWIAGEVTPDQERWSEIERVMGLDPGTLANARDVMPPGVDDHMLLIELGLRVVTMDGAVQRLEDRIRALEQSLGRPDAQSAPPTDLTSRGARAGKRGA